MIDGGGAEHNDYKSYLKIEISEKKKEENLCVFDGKRPPAAFKLGGVPVELSRNVLLAINSRI